MYFSRKTPRVAEVVLAQPAHGVEGLGEFRVRAAHAHADAAATGGALEHHRITDLLRGRQCPFQGIQQLGALQQRHALGARQGPRRVLETKGAQLLGGGPDEGDAGGFAGFGEGGVLGEEAITRVNGLGAALGAPPRGSLAVSR